MTSHPTDADTYDDVPLSALLQAARNTYSHAVQAAQSQIGCDDFPTTGGYLVSAMHWSGASLESVIRWMGVTKQAVSQAVEMLVVRGYLERSHDPSDRRKVNLTLTERGRDAGKAARLAIERVDRELRSRLGAQKVAHARATLVTLLEMDRKARGPRARPSEEPRTLAKPGVPTPRVDSMN
jgi:DNA-binding MarR family transcriptional regulator